MSVNLTVTLKDGNLEKALKQMKRKMIKDGLFNKMRENKTYEKPSDRKIRKMKEMKVNTKKKKRERERNL